MQAHTRTRGGEREAAVRGGIRGGRTYIARNICIQAREDDHTVLEVLRDAFVDDHFAHDGWDSPRLLPVDGLEVGLPG